MKDEMLTRVRNIVQEFICMEESVSDTQKKIRQWASEGYKIEIISQTAFAVFDISQFGQHDKTIVITSLWRWAHLEPGKTFEERK